MTDPSTSTPTRPRDGWVSLGMTVSATSAALSSFSGLHDLAIAAGWAPLMAPLGPLTVDAFAATATRVWLAASTTSERARRFARRCAVGAILLSLVGNAVWHLIAAHLLIVNWIVVLAVGSVPPLVLGLVSHLAVLRRQTDTAVPVAVPVTVPASAPVTPRTRTAPRTAQSSPARPQYRTEDDLLTAARAADVAWRQDHGGRPIYRDELRRTIKIGGERATAALRQLRAEMEGGSPLSIPQQPKSQTSGSSTSRTSLEQHI